MNWKVLREILIGLGGEGVALLRARREARERRAEAARKAHFQQQLEALLKEAEDIEKTIDKLKKIRPGI
jgi:hypothetical protein